MIRVANKTDVRKCFGLDREVGLQNFGSEKDGFLLGKDSLQDYEAFFSEGVCFVHEEDNQLGGFIVGYKKDSRLIPEYAKCVLESSLEPAGLLKDIDFFYIEKVVVSPLFRRRGIARGLYDRLFEEYSGLSFVAAVAEKPLKNFSSHKFHTHMGFEVVGSYQPNENSIIGIYLKSAAQ